MQRNFQAEITINTQDENSPDRNKIQLMSEKQILSQNEITQKGVWPLTEAEAKIIFKQVIYGINYMHQRNVVHRDIKLENIIFDKDQQKVKLVDFGFSICLKDIKQKIKVFCGTPTYMAPEIVTKDKNRNSLNECERGYEAPPADIWALGVVLYALLSGRFPFKPPKTDANGKEYSKRERNE